jgi:regulator of protease activity HflC (stomatin/prohibitin superfamily)
MNIMFPGLDRLADQDTIREKVMDIPPQNCITRDNVSITADAVIYWRIMDMEKSYYKVQNLQGAMINLALAQVRAEMGNSPRRRRRTAAHRLRGPGQTSAAGFECSGDGRGRGDRHPGDQR